MTDTDVLGPVDASQDTIGTAQWELCKLCPPPDFVKKASADQIMGHDALGPGMYADPASREFPCHTAAATWTSMGLFTLGRSKVHEKRAESIERRIEAAGRHYGIYGQLKQLKSALQKNLQHSENDLEDDEFALVVTWDDGRKERHYPLRNQAEIGKAASYLMSYANELVYADRQVMAEKIIKRAAAADVEWDDETENFLYRTAGQGTCSSETAARYLLEQARVLKHCKQAAEAIPIMEKLATLAQRILQEPGLAHVPSHLRKMAALVDETHRAFGIRSQVLPEKILFPITIKEAQALREEHIPTITGKHYAKADLIKLSLNDVRDHLGDEVADAISPDGIFVDMDKLAAVLPTLPRPDAEIFDKLVRQRDIQPTYKQAGMDRVKIPIEELCKMADSHIQKRRQQQAKVEGEAGPIP